MHKMKRVLSIVVTVCMLVSILATGAFAVSISTKPENGTTKGQPFAPGTGGSQNFRIPGIITLDDGTLIAACDARWNHAGDGAGLDTIVSVSKDNGENWTYTFANYLGDNGDTYNNLSTCIIDPGIGTDGETAYLIADLWPAGIALNTSKYGPIAGENGFDNNGNLLLRALSEDTVTIGSNGYNTMAGQVSRYKFYLDLETLTLHKADGTPIEGYTVDAFFNITGNGVNTNLFFADSPYQPYPTDYLYMTTSTDGLNWSEPTLLNLQEDAEQTLLVGPGNGTYDEKNDRMIFTAYEHTSGYERTSLIWMDDQGNWHRSEDATYNNSNKSSEATAVVLEDGTVRVFYRDYSSVLNYSDYIWSEEENNYVVSQTEVATNAPKRQNNQLTSILYSERIDGKEVILVACAANPNDRRDGHLYVFLVNEDKSMDLAYDYDIIPGEDEVYAYNCITEMNDGNIALLYENQGSQITYLVIDMENVLSRDNDPNLTVKNVELLEGYSATFTDNSGWYKDADLTELDPEVATAELTGGETVTNAAKVLGSGATIDLDTCQYTFTKKDDGYFEVSAVTADGTTVYLNHFSTTGNNIPNVTSPAGKIAVLSSAHENMFKLVAMNIDGSSNPDRGLHFHAEYESPYWNRCGNDSTYKCHEYLFRKAAAGETSSTEIPGYVMITSLEDVVDGEYLIAARNDAGNWFVLNPSTASDKFSHVAQIMGSTTVGYTEITFTGVGAGYTEVVIGSTLYKITVHAVENVNVDLSVGGSKTFYERSGNYADADTSDLDTSIATVTLAGVDGTMDNGLSLEPVTELVEGEKYVIVNTRANKILTNGSSSNQNAVGLLLNGDKKSEIADAALWTYVKVAGGNSFQDQDGKYMTVGASRAGLSTTETVLTVSYQNSGAWAIGQNGQYLNHFGGSGSTCAAGYSSIDAGSLFDIYTYTTNPHGPSTEITFTGMAAGTTDVLIGHTLYKITVTEGSAECQHEWSDWTSTATCTEAGVESRTCALCNETESREVAALGHDYVAHEVVPPTCTKSGYTVYKCTRCDKTYKDDPVEPEHQFDEGTVTAPTCTEQGYTTYTCTVCGDKYVDEASWTDALGHDFVDGDCSRCDEVLTSRFEDVKAGLFYFDPVEWAVGKGITTGITATTFNPDRQCTRAEVVTFLWRAAGSPEPTTTENPFDDVKEGDFFYKAVLWANEKNITNGLDADTFGPFELCNRAQVVTFLWRSQGSPASTADVAFTDVEDGLFYSTAVAWAVEHNITNGISATEFGVDGICNRAQVVTFLYRTLG